MALSTKSWHIQEKTFLWIVISQIAKEAGYKYRILLVPGLSRESSGEMLNSEEISSPNISKQLSMRNSTSVFTCANQRRIFVNQAFVSTNSYLYSSSYLRILEGKFAGHIWCSPADGMERKCMANLPCSPHLFWLRAFAHHHWSLLEMPGRSLESGGRV